MKDEKKIKALTQHPKNKLIGISISMSGEIWWSLYLGFILDC